MSSKEKTAQLSAGLIADEVARKIDTLFAELNSKLRGQGLAKIPKNQLYPAALIEFLKNKLSLLESVPEARKAIFINQFIEEVQKVLREAYLREP
ncbi:hypothetical protein MUP01_10640 [Candidatus Bathyarchaeota archaeon]|jgi:hypothetical protein|nr:hypothetical protein [Candidatus Bathyarchaeota archaeon]